MSDPKWPDQIWLAGDGHRKRRSHPHEEGAIAYVRADAYDELLEWCRVMIVEGEACPCTMPAPIAEQPPLGAEDGGVDRG